MDVAGYHVDMLAIAALGFLVVVVGLTAGITVWVLKQAAKERGKV